MKGNNRSFEVVAGVAVYMLILSAFSAQNAYSECDNPKTLSVVGVSAGGENDSPADVKKAAMQDAKRKASERAGTVIESISLVEDYSLVEDEIRTWTAAKMKVLDESASFECHPKLGNITTTATITVEICPDEFGKYYGSLMQAQLSDEEKTRPIEFTFGIFSKKGRNEIRLRDGDVIRSGDEFWIEFTPRQDCHVYVLNETPSGDIDPMFPHPKVIGKTAVKGGRTTRLPSKTQNYFADENTGTERIHLVASVVELSDLEYLLRRVASEKADSGDRELLLGRARARGLAEVVDTGSTSGSELGIEVLKQHGSLIRTSILKHE